MITNILTGLKEDRAKFVRELAYIRENAEEDLIADRVEKAERALGRKSDDFESFVEAVSIVDTMDDDYATEDAEEINRILEANNDLTFDEMIGLE